MHKHLQKKMLSTKAGSQASAVRRDIAWRRGTTNKLKATDERQRRFTGVGLTLALGCTRPQPSHPHSLHKTTTARRSVHRISRHGVTLGTTAQRCVAGWSSALSWHSKFWPLRAGVHGGSHLGGDEGNLQGNTMRKLNIASTTESSRLGA
jgi:hypothetical protein